jgi:hypothetical protein
MKGLSRAWFRANAGKVIDIGQERRRRSKRKKLEEEKEQRDIRQRVIERARTVFPEAEDPVEAAAYVAVKERLLSLGFGTHYAHRAADWIAMDFAIDAYSPTFDLDGE